MSRDFDLSAIGERYEFGSSGLRDDQYTPDKGFELHRFKTIEHTKIYARLYRGSVFKPHPDGGYHLAKNCACNLCSDERKAKIALAHAKYLEDNKQEIEQCKQFFLDNYETIKDAVDFSIEAINDDRYTTESATEFRLAVMSYIKYFGYDAGLELSINSPVVEYAKLDQLKKELNQVLELYENVILANPIMFGGCWSHLTQNKSGWGNN